MAIDKTLYTAQVNVSGGRDGQAVSSDGQLNVKLATPQGLGGSGGEGTNPEQLFAAGYAACFLSALKLVMQKQKVETQQQPSIDSKVEIGPQGEGFGLAVELRVTVPEVPRDQAQELIETAHQVCPYSNATRGNVDVTLVLAE